MAILGIAVMDRQSPVSANADSLIKDSQVASLRVEIVTWRLPAMATSVHFTLKSSLSSGWGGSMLREMASLSYHAGQALANSQGRPEGQVPSPCCRPLVPTLSNPGCEHENT